jgi:DNA sulfur modification protein DndC
MLRIAPVQQVIHEVVGQSGESHAVVLLGLRNGESQQRDRSMVSKKTDDQYIQKQGGAANTTVFTPIINFTLDDVWTVIDSGAAPTAIDGKRLRLLYRAVDGECPVITDSKAKPCAGNRFGCWTCTVVRRDRAVESLIATGEQSLQPLLDFRNWMAVMRADPTNREPFRRNGALGPGPLTLAARREMLSRLEEVQAMSPWPLIGEDEKAEIRRLWAQDECRPTT